MLVKNGQLESFQNMKEKFDLDKQEFYRYLQLRDYFLKEMRTDPSGEVHGVIQLIINTYKENKIRIVSGLYKKLVSNKHSTKYIKEKWDQNLR